jgi:hypothetical protein
MTSYQAQSRIRDTNHVSRTLLYSYLKRDYPDLGDHLSTFFGCRRRLYWRYRRLWTLYTAMYTPGIASPRPKPMYSTLATDLVTVTMKVDTPGDARIT